MKPLTQEQISDAYFSWRIHFFNRELERKLTPYLSKEIKAAKWGWLRNAREAFFLSGTEVARRLNISRAAYAKLEKAEETGGITLLKLAQAAEALDCELVYAIRPKSRKPFSEILWQMIVPKCEKESWVQVRPENLKSRALAAVARIKTLEPSFRQKMGWSKRK